MRRSGWLGKDVVGAESLQSAWYKFVGDSSSAQECGESLFFAIVFDADSSPANSHAELAELRDPPKGGWLVDSSGFDTLLRRVTNSMFRQNARTSPFWQQKHNHDDYIFVVFYSFGLFFEIRPRRISDLR